MTLVEVLVAAAVVALLSTGVAGFVQNQSKALNNSIDSNLATQMALRATALMRYDFSGAQTVYVFGASAPTNRSATAGAMCSTDSTATSVAWGTNSSWTSSPTPIRLLFSIVIADLGDPLTIDPSLPAWRQPSTSLVGYEIRRRGTGQFELWRNVCEGTMLTYGMQVSADKSELLLQLGDNLSAVVSGQNNLSCAGLLCSVYTGAETTNSPYYSFSLPVSTSSRLSVLKPLMDPFLGRLSSRIEGIS